MTTYSAEDFVFLADEYGKCAPTGHFPIVAAALRIASRVMEPGVIEEALGEIDFNDASDEQAAAAIRAKLTGGEG